MTIKKTVPALTLALMLALSGGLAQAQSADDPPAPDRISPMAPEDWAAARQMRLEHEKKMQPLRDQLWVKEKEYDFLKNNPNAKLDDARPVIAEMSRLKSQLRAEREGFRAQLEAKGYPMARRHGPGWDKGDRWAKWDKHDRGDYRRHDQGDYRRHDRGPGPKHRDRHDGYRSHRDWRD